MASSSLAITTEIIALMPAKNKSFATSLLLSMKQAGIAIAGFVFAGIIETDIFKSSWNLGGLALSNYDAVLLGCSIMVVLLIATLTFVPSVVQKAEWLPKQG